MRNEKIHKTRYRSYFHLFFTPIFVKIIIKMKTHHMTILSVCFVLFAAMTNKTTAQSKFDSWPQLKEFHTVMSQTFHPAEEGNLEPIKTRIGEMVEKASALKSSTIPAEFNNKNVVKAVSKLETNSKKLQKKIDAKASDEKIKKSITALHDVFHQIVGLCSEEGEH